MDGRLSGRGKCLRRGRRRRRVCRREGRATVDVL